MTNSSLKKSFHSSSDKDGTVTQNRSFSVAVIRSIKCLQTFHSVESSNDCDNIVEQVFHFSVVKIYRTEINICDLKVGLHYTSKSFNGQDFF